MKTLLLALLALSPLLAQAAPSYELSVVAGSPNTAQESVSRILKNSVEIAKGENEQDYTTGLFYFADRNGAQAAQAILLINERGTATTFDFFHAIDIGAVSSKIVLVPLGGGSPDPVCKRAAGTPRTVFLFAANALMEENENGPCRAKNILFITALNKDLSDVSPVQKTGPLVRLAVPAVNLKAPATRTIILQSTGFGMAMAAGKLAETSREHPQLWGAALIERFLNTKADRLSALRGKVVGERALLHFNQ